MKNPTVHIGFTLLTDCAEGGRQVAGMTGHTIGGLDALQLTGLQELLINEFKDDFDTFLKPVLLRLTDLGYAIAASGGADASDIAATKAQVKGKPNK